MAKEALDGWKERLRDSSVFQKNYEVDSSKTVDERKRLAADRLKGYQTICLAGLGSMFWGAASWALSHLKITPDTENSLLVQPSQQALPHWVKFYPAFAAFALLFMLLGVAASSFPDSSPLAAGVAGFGGLQALIFIAGAFHIASLQFHSFTEECFYSLIVTTVLVTVYWSLSAQDPLPLHIMVKGIWWLIKAFPFVVCYLFYHGAILFYYVAMGVKYVCGGIASGAVYLFLRARGYQQLPQQPHLPLQHLPQQPQLPQQQPPQQPQLPQQQPPQQPQQQPPPQP